MTAPQVSRFACVSCALGAATGLALAKDFGLTSKVAYNAAFICCATGGAALATAVAAKLRSVGRQEVRGVGILVAMAFACETFQQERSVILNI